MDHLCLLEVGHDLLGLFQGMLKRRAWVMQLVEKLQVEVEDVARNLGHS